jgi:hypothetical protein
MPTAKMTLDVVGSPLRKSRRASVVRTLKALQRAGLGVAAIKHEPDGTVIVIPGTPDAVSSSEPNPWMRHDPARTELC